jgi:hypothetical protein
MADNVQITAGSGTTIATDDAGAGGHVQVVKLALSADGSATPIPATADGIAVQGSVAHDAADAGNPVGVGLQARTTNPTAVADADRVRAIADKVGRQVVVVSQVRDLVTQATVVVSTTTETTIIAAGGAGVFHDVAAIVIFNRSTGSVQVRIRDATGGAHIWAPQLPPSGGWAMAFPTPWKQGAANNNWTVELGTAATDVTVSLQCVKNT